MMRSGEYISAQRNKCALCGGSALALLLCERILTVPVTVVDREQADAPSVERCVCAACAEAVAGAHADLLDELSAPVDSSPVAAE